LPNSGVAEFRIPGNATDRNIHQKSLEEAVKMCNAVYATTVDAQGVEEALQIYWS